MEFKKNLYSDYGECKLENDEIIFKSNCTGEINFYIEFDFSSFDDKFVLLPSCIYDGNPIKVVIKRPYPPYYEKEEMGVDCEEIMSEVPCLGKDKDGYFEVTSGDLATPCFAVYSKKENECVFVFTEQEIKGKNLGYSGGDGKIRITYPKMRKERYRLCRVHPESGDVGIDCVNGEELKSKIKILTFPCTSVLNLYEIFFKYRKTLLNSPRAKFEYTKELWDLMENHFNTCNYKENFYGTFYGSWGPGWTGCGMSTTALYKKGNKITKKRCIETLDYLSSHQSPAGFFYSKALENGEILGDPMGGKYLDKMHLIRRSADILYFLFKHFYLEGLDVKDDWIICAQKCANAFCSLFENYGKLGQYVDISTGEMLVGTSCAGSLVPAALALAYKYLGDEDYLVYAKQIADYYYNNYLVKGYTNGGPGDILCAIDSESGFNLLESFVVLYEITNEEKYLNMAKDCANYCSTWVVSYSYKFPDDSMFGKLDINTVGAVYANIQNKHGAPGICTLSGDSLYKLWKYTNDDKYLELIKDIVSCIPQCVSRDEKPIYSWDTPPRKIPAGYINERINLSDWETIGAVFYDSCWCETSLILTYAELMDYPEFKD